MDFGFKTVSLPGLKNLSRFFKGKTLLFAEDIAEFCESFLSHLRNHLFSQQIHITRPFLSEFLRNGMGSQKGGDDIDGMAFLQSFHHSENLHFTLERKPVSAFCFHGRYSLGKHSVQSSLAKGKKFIKESLPGRL